MDRIFFTVNGDKCSVGSEVDSDVSLVDYIRNVLNLRGTKYMCREGGCGACIVNVSTRDSNGHYNTFSVNSCLVSITSCHEWDITTIEGIGDRRKGYHPLQKTLAEYNGTQCGYCSPGWVMAMYSLLESSDYNLTQYEIETSLGSNICRCTGIRPILDAFKSFAKDAPQPKPKTYVSDIEDIKLCTSKGKCQNTCKNDWCIVQNDDVDNRVLKIKLKDGRVWYRVKEIKDIFEIFEKEGTDSYMLVNGNTGKGAVPILEYPRVLIDIKPISELTGYYFDQNLVIGAGTTLTGLLEIFKTVCHKYEYFWYLEKFYEHIELVAHIPVRNIASIAGNLMTKHRQPTFPSDIFLLFESVGATLTIVSKQSLVDVLPEEFLQMDMSGKLITRVKLPPLSVNNKFVSFKIMPRAQNAHASVNGAFLYELDSNFKEETVLSARIVITGLSGSFVHAKKTEQFLVHRKLFKNETLQSALKVLNEELCVEKIAGELKPEYRKKCALGIFYKGLLNLIPRERLKPWYRSGARDFRKTRSLSKGTQVYDTNPIIWPINEPMPKVEALIQCAGEARYVNDLPTQPREVYCAFVTSDICTGEILEIDPTPALKISGVLAFFKAKDIPGDNSFVYPVQVPGSTINFEEIFANKFVKYYDQPIGILVAETERLVNRAALLVRVKYKKDKIKPILTNDAARERDPSRVSLFFAYPARNRGADVRKIVKSTDNIYHQYHYTMETLSCVCRPSDDGLDVFPSTQWPDLTHIAISRSLKIEQNRISLDIPRCGGSYGSKISRATHIAAACSLVTHLLNRPCRFVMNIQANIRCIGKRNPASREFEAGVNDKGEIQFLNISIYSDNGYVIGEPTIQFGNTAVKNCYDNRRWQYAAYNVVTDTASNTYIRSPGTLEAITMTEHIMEQISYEMNLDPIQVRLNNISPQTPEVTELVQIILKDSEFYKRRAEMEKFNKTNRWKKRGLRVAFLSWPVPILFDFHTILTVHHGDGTITVCHGGVEMGQGINTKVIQSVAYTLNIPVHKVKIKSVDCVSSANPFVTGTSKTSEAVCFSAIKCCQILLDRLTVVRESLTDPTWEVLIQAAFNRGINLQTEYRVTPPDQNIYRSSGVGVSEVELDILTGEHEVIRVDLIEDVGTTMNPELDIGQVEGAFIMGLGYWTHEHLIIDEDTGEVLTDRTWNYHVPITKDIPIDFRVQLRRNSFSPIGALGAKAVAEPPINLAVSVAFALREAIVSSREDSGYPREKWFQQDGPFTLEFNVLKCDARLEEFLYN